MTGFTVSDVVNITGGVLHGGGCGAPVTGGVIDSRAVRPGELFCALRGERVDGHEYIARALAAGASACLAERVPEGVEGPVIVVPDVTAAMASLASECRRRFSGPVVGIVGSSGKTTAKELCARVLGEKYKVLYTEGNLNNELGVPLTLFRLDGGTEAAVIELGISDFGEMTRLGRMARPDIAVYTLIGRSHLSTLGDLDGVLRAKTELLGEMRPDGLVIVNGDDARLAALSPVQRKLMYSAAGRGDINAGPLSVTADGGVGFDIFAPGRRIRAEIPAFGRQLVFAALAAAAVGIELGLSDVQIAAGLSKYAPVGHRTRLIKTRCLTIVDDCYNSNPDSAALAIDSASDLPGRLVCILGDMLNLGPGSEDMHRAVGLRAREKAALLLTAGDAATAMGGEHFAGRDELISALPEYLRPGDTVLVKASHAMEFERIVDALQELKL